MCEQPCEDRLRRRTVLAGSGALAVAGTLLPGVAFAEPDGAEPTGEQTRTVTGTLRPDVPDWYYLPVDVPRGVREIEVSYSYDRPQVPQGAKGNSLDIGMFSPAGIQLGNDRGFRGWSGGARDRFTISAGAATPGYLPGPIEPGRWHVLLGPYTVAQQGLNYSVTVTLRFGHPDPAFRPAPAPVSAPARDRGRAWYRGDGHLHTVHSDGLRTPAELVAAARAAGLDFIVSTEHNTSSAALQWGAHATDDLLIVNGEEVTTRTGHWPAWHLPAGKWIDWRYRAGDRHQFRRFAEEVRRAGGLVVAAHPFTPCVGCSWGFGYQHADLVEVWNGPWTLDDEASVINWDGLLRAGTFLPAVGNSDAHNLDHVVGLPQNVVLADELGPRRLMDGFKAGRSWIAESAGVELTFTATDGTRRAGIGERLRAGTGAPVTVELTVSGVPGTAVRFLDQNGPQWIQPVGATGTATVRWVAQTRYSQWVRAEVRRPVATATTPDTMVALTNPIFLDS
ncbi:MAG TPA: CehA/McbA family metallohydrolase [Actinophytocola sp.]|uniref:CehA/McbA family metallohydrolase n=1 Tax=Actinophytocola sp. TaxID=1872138 RepID=UPI002DB5FF4F|nr:CehA/McbA family metallohydrolase [Actinophytocola sp.]HEU5471931.1 CehA/McbA family metallohydrolase [Actinophytocola sp.]